MKASRVVLLAAVLAAAALLWTDLRGQATAPPPRAAATSAPATCPVAVLDVEEVITNYQRAIDLRKGLENRRNALLLEDQKRKDAIAQIEATLRSLAEGSAEYVKQVNEMRRLAIDRDAFLRFETSLLESEHHRLLRALYEDVAKMAAIVAQQAGYKVVLYVDRKLPKTNNSNELTAVLKDRKVVWADPSVDITETVLKRLNDALRTATSRP
jgi:Skp family chaperone for outer membrane proteins